jgi:hypothetical protein
MHPPFSCHLDADHDAVCQNVGIKPPVGQCIRSSPADLAGFGVTLLAAPRAVIGSTTLILPNHWNHDQSPRFCLFL